MKKQLLLGSALLAFAFASAQTVQNIPTAPGTTLRISAEDVKFDAVLEVDDNGNPIEHFTKHEKMSYLDENGKKVAAPDEVYVNNTHDGEAASWFVKSEAESCYVIRFQYSSKNDAPGAWGTFKLLDKATENTVWEKRYDAAAVQTASYAFAPTEVYVETPIPAGEYIFKVEFQQEDPLKPSFRMCRVEFEAREEIQEVNLMTYCEPAEGGSITITPSRNKFISGTEVKAQAIAATGYKFTGWDNGIDDPFTTNPYTFVIEEDIDLVANFEEVQMWSDVPGYVQFENTRLMGGQGEVQYDRHTIKIWNDEAQDYVAAYPEDAFGTIPWLGKYYNNKGEEFDINFTEDGVYNFVFHWSWKNNDKGQTPSLAFELYDKAAYEDDPAMATPVWNDTFAPEAPTTQWFCFKEQKLDNINLTKGHKILRITFKEPVANKETMNILDMKFGIGDNYGSEAAIEEVAVDADKAVRAYNLQGIEVPATTKGLIIVDGKKVYNK